VTEWLSSLTSNHLALTAVGTNPERDFTFFMWGNYLVSITDHRWFYLCTLSCLKLCTKRDVRFVSTSKADTPYAIMTLTVGNKCFALCPVLFLFGVLLDSLPAVLCCWVVWRLRSLSTALPCWSCFSY
jgi:hypothetical protein